MFVHVSLNNTTKQRGQNILCLASIAQELIHRQCHNSNIQKVLMKLEPCTISQGFLHSYISETLSSIILISFTFIEKAECTYTSIAIYI